MTVHDGEQSDASRRGEMVGVLKMGTWNIGSMSGRAGELVEVLRRRRVDICCVQETRWRGKSARWLGPHGSRYKFLWSGGDDGSAGVGVMLSEEFLDNVACVNRISNRLMLVRLMLDRRPFTIVSAYAPQVGRSAEEKEEFWQSLHDALSSINISDAVFLGGDLNGHVGRHSDGYDGVHGGKGYGTRNSEGECILDLGDMFDLAICNTFFVKPENHLVTYESGGNKSQIDYVLVRRSDLKLVKNVKAIPNEECVKQHSLVVTDYAIKKKQRITRPFVPRLKIWKLRERNVRQAFEEEVRRRDMEVVNATNLNEKWIAMKKVWLEVTEQTCGRTKGPPQGKETWWWNDDVAGAVAEKRARYSSWRKSKTESDRNLYREARRKARQTVWEAQQAKLSEMAHDMESNHSDQSIFKVAKKMSKEQEDPANPAFMKDDAGRMITDERMVREKWRSYMSALMNVMNQFDSTDEVMLTEGPSCKVNKSEVIYAVKRSRRRKAPGPSGLVVEMVEASGDVGIEWLTDLFNAILIEGSIPTDWQRSVLIPLFKGKGDPQSFDSYRAIKLLDQVMKIFERILERRIREVVTIDQMQFGFMPGRGTTDAIFLIRQLQEKYHEKRRSLFLGFIDLEKAFDRVPRPVVQWALRSLGVGEWLVRAVMSLFSEAKSVVRWRSDVSDSFDVSVGVHQGSVLSPLLFACVLDVVTRNVRGGLPWEALFADDLILIAESEQELADKISAWRSALFNKGLVVNTNKTKVMLSAAGSGEVEPSGRNPCAVCRRGVGSNSIKCTMCLLWVHKRCSGVEGRLASVASTFVCRRCGGELSEDPSPRVGNGDALMVDNRSYEVVKKFRYLGDTIDAGGGASAAVQARIRSGWGRFRAMAPFLTSKAVSLKMKSKIYSACVQSSMLYGSETWALTTECKKRLEVTEMRMVRWMCGVSSRDRISNDDLRGRMRLEPIGDTLRRRRLRWCGHVERKDETQWVKRVWKMEVEGRRPVGRPKKTWNDNIKEDLTVLGLSVNDAWDRDKWRSAIQANRRTQPSWNRRR